jgi:hypothetical protein
MCSRGRCEELCRAAPVSLESFQGTIAMDEQSDLDRRNDIRLITPLLLMALILVFGVLLYLYTGHALAAAI